MEAKIEIAAIAMWQHEASTAPTSARNGRTPRSWLDQAPELRMKWRGLAQAALEAVEGQSE